MKIRKRHKVLQKVCCDMWYDLISMVIVVASYHSSRNMRPRTIAVLLHTAYLRFIWHPDIWKTLSTASRICWSIYLKNTLPLDSLDVGSGCVPGGPFDLVLKFLLFILILILWGWGKDTLCTVPSILYFTESMLMFGWFRRSSILLCYWFIISSQLINK